MRVTYGITKEIHLSQASNRVSYGIAAYSDFSEDDCATVVAAVHHVTSDRQAIANLVSLCNQLELSPTHLHDVVEDFLVE